VDNDGQVSGIPSGKFTQVSAGFHNSCAVRESGAVKCWGTDKYGQVSKVPTGTFTQVAVGSDHSPHGDHSCALTEAGKVACWGGNEKGQSTPPPDLAAPVEPPQPEKGDVVSKIKTTVASHKEDLRAAREVFEETCAECHEIDEICGHGADDAQGWQKVVETMIEEGAEISESDARKILEYLVQNYSEFPVVPCDVPIPNDAERTASGLASKVLKRGTGKRHPRATSKVTVHYTGWTTDGKIFDSSVQRDRTATFPLSRVIPGWTEGLQLMVVGEKRRLWIPQELAYKGKSGPPQGMLIFDVELFAIK
jgi:FKBP-type peptidyl-prolyl cis-trans isomerase